MNNIGVLNRIVTDLKVAYSLAEDISNNYLKSYVDNRLNIISTNEKVYQYSSINTLVESYIIDLQLFINISIIVNDSESKDYFKGRLMDIMNIFPYLKSRNDLVGLL